MANVKFLRGTQANLNTLIAGTGNRFSEGAFYLTTDTDRLYVAQSATELVLLNSIINHVASVSALPSFSSAEPGDFYYAQAENILCTKRTGQTTWTQINPDTRLAATASNTNVSSVTGGAQVAIAVSEDRLDGNNNTSSGHFSIVGAGTATVTQENNVITITGGENSDTTYELSAESGNKITLTPSEGDVQEVTIAGSGLASVSTNTSTDTITVSVPTSQIALTESAAFDANGNLNLSTTIAGDSANPATASVTPVIKLDTTATAAANGEYKFASGTATLPVYTKGEVDSAINTAKAAIDAMTYKGTVSASDAATKLASTGNVGDTYKAATGITSVNGVSGNDAKIGDLLIAEGTDGNVTWSIVPSGDDQSISGEVNAANKSMIVKDGVNTLAGIQIADGTHISATGSVTNDINTITISQAADYTAQTASGSSADVSVSGTDSSHVHNSGTFTAVTAIQTDAYGNVVNNSIKTKTLTIKDTHANIQSVGTSISASSNDATIGISVSDSDTESASGSFHLTSSGSTISVTSPSSSTVNVDIVWGSFDPA